MTTYDIGDAPTVTATFRNLSDVLTSPTTVTVQHLQPDGTQAAVTPVTTVSAGVHSVVVPTITRSGQHVVKFFGTGALVAAEETVLNVRSTKVT